jgi:class 3 adenylate cyclase/streptogramin lyase
MMRRGREHRLATILFTDIVGSTQIAAELGDRRWHALLTRHHAIVRKLLKQFHGRELDTAGDGFFATFGEPSDAIRCADAIEEAVRELGIEVRAGLNLGEAEVIGDKLGGVAVHAAARIMAQAGPGEVLVASTVKDLVPGSGFTFAGQGTTELRGVPGEWRLFVLTAVDGTPRGGPASDQTAAERRAAIEPPPVLRRRGGLVAGIGAGLLAGVILAFALTAHGATPRTSGAPSAPPAKTRAKAAPVPHVDQIDSSGEIVHRIPVGNSPGSIAFGDGSVWVSNGADGTVTRIDPATRRTVTIDVTTVGPLAIGRDGVWVASQTDLLRIDPATNTVVQTISRAAPYGIESMAIDDRTGVIWIGYPNYSVNKFGNPEVAARYDVAKGKFVQVTGAGCCFGTTLEASGGSVWFGDSRADLWRFNAETGLEESYHNYGAKQVLAAIVWEGNLWFATASGGAESSELAGGELIPVSLKTNRAGDPVAVGGAPSGIAVLNGDLWALDSNGGLIAYHSGVVQPPRRIDGPATSIAAGEGYLWVTIDPSA